jgi:predicted nucleic acid-binding Zn ribbon protein
MYCPNCGKEIADEAVVCIGCGRPVTPLKKAAAPVQNAIEVGAKAVHVTARVFLIGGILNIVVGIISTAVGWFIGIFAVIVGIIELVNAYQYWPVPPRKTSNPTYLPILEMISAICGSLWFLFIGYANRRRLNSPEVKNYFLALQSGQPVVAGSNATIANAVAAGIPVVPVKKCPSCGNSIPIEAKICQFCRQSFSEEEIRTAKNQFEADLIQKQAEALETRQIKRGKSLRASGVIIAAIGLVILILCVVIQVTSPPSADNSEGFILVILLCPTPLILLGGGLFAWGTYSLRKLKEEKEKPKPIQTISI